MVWRKVAAINPAAPRQLVEKDCDSAFYLAGWQLVIPSPANLQRCCKQGRKLQGKQQRTTMELHDEKKKVSIGGRTFPSTGRLSPYQRGGQQRGNGLPRGDTSHLCTCATGSWHGWGKTLNTLSTVVSPPLN